MSNNLGRICILVNVDVIDKSNVILELSSRTTHINVTMILIIKIQNYSVFVGRSAYS